MISGLFFAPLMEGSLSSDVCINGAWMAGVYGKGDGGGGGYQVLYARGGALRLCVPKLKQKKACAACCQPRMRINTKVRRKRNLLAVSVGGLAPGISSEYGSRWINYQYFLPGLKSA
jgi:hypothetical protein